LYVKYDTFVFLFNILAGFFYLLENIQRDYKSMARWNSMRDDDKRQLFHAVTLAGSIGLNIVATIVVGLLLGRLVDQWLDIQPWASIVGIIFGMVTGLWVTYKRVTDKS
jgi:ATP synthase protein I